MAPVSPEKGRDEPQLKKKKSAWQVGKEVGPYMALGWQFLGAMAFLGYLGNWIDEHYDTKPWGLFWGVILGLIAGFYNVFRIILNNSEKKADN